MITIICFAIAAAAGACARGAIGQFTNRPSGFAFGTLIVNVVGSFALGALSNVDAPAITVLGVGFLGSFTTFSSFARDTVALVELKKALLAATYLIVTLAASVGAAALGIWAS